jgi:hypothetical protein
MKHKVSELDGALLDAAVALAEGWRPDGNIWSAPTWLLSRAYDGAVTETPTVRAEFHLYQWSTDWRYGGPIIERERITVVAFTGYNGDDPLRWWAQVGDFSHYIDEPLPGYQDDRCGPTPLIAAMRAYVASKFGEEVELP